MKFNILIIDDHPAIVEGYKSILSLYEGYSNFKITTAGTCEAAYDSMTVNPRTHYHIVLLDVILPPKEQLGLKDGIDVGKMVRKVSPDSKLIMLTSHTEAFVLYKIIKEVNPNGLLIKSDFEPAELICAFEAVLNNETYRSITVQSGINEILKKDIYLDTYNRQIISLLSQGIKTKNLPSHLNLSISAIDKRKAQIKDYFEIEKGNDEDIIKAAKQHGFV
ncbi:MAG TPA: response regulator [Flavobacterium sp.]|jgi:DNA-binding NarL/FixJ family response regulator